MRRQPPNLAQRFVHWFCDDKWTDEVIGDLEEQFADNTKTTFQLNFTVHGQTVQEDRNGKSLA